MNDMKCEKCNSEIAVQLIGWSEFGKKYDSMLCESCFHIFTDSVVKHKTGQLLFLEVESPRSGNALPILISNRPETNPEMESERNISLCGFCLSNEGVKKVRFKSVECPDSVLCGDHLRELVESNSMGDIEISEVKHA